MQNINSIVSKALILLALIFILGFPIDNFVKMSVLCIGIFSILLCKLRKRSTVSVLAFFATIILCKILLAIIPNTEVDVGFNIFTPSERNTRYYNSIPEPILTDLVDQFLAVYPKSSWCSQDEPYYCWRSVHEHSSLWAFSPESIWNDAQKTTIRTNLIGQSARDLRVGSINSNGYKSENTNWIENYSNVLRSQVPILISFKLLTPQFVDKICWRGNLWEYIDNQSKYIGHSDSVSCVSELDGIENNFILLGWPSENSEIIEVVWSRVGIFLQVIHILIPVALSIIIVSFYVDIRSFKARDDWKSILIVLIVNLIFIYKLNGLQLVDVVIHEAGGDGLVHAGYGRSIMQYAAQFNWYESIKGVEPTYYYMPGLRYFNALGMFLFGDTTLASLLLLIFLPLPLYLVSKVYIGRLASLAFMILFVFPYFIKRSIDQSLGGAAEPLGYFLYLSGFYLLVKFINRDLPSDKRYLLLIGGALLSSSIFVRPNLIISFALFSVAYFVIVYKRCSISTVALFATSLIPVMFSFLHNFYYDSTLVLFTSAGTHQANLLTPPMIYIDAAAEILNIKSGRDSVDHLLNHLGRWIGPYGIWCFVLIAIFITLCNKLVIKSLGKIDILIILNVIGLQLVHLFWHPDGRYALLTWFFTALLACRLIFLLFMVRNTNEFKMY